MIATIEGQLVELNGETALVEVGAVGYEALLPAYASQQLAGQIGQPVRLYTIAYLEGSPAVGNLVPRLVGFLSRAEKEFFEIFTSVKGLGVKKSLKALAMPIERVAQAIENGDTQLLANLPGIGKKTAGMIIAELKGKLGRFAAACTAGATVASAGSGAFATYQTEALEILIAWGEKRAEAIELIQLACRKYPDIKTAEALVPLVYRIKQGIEV